MCLLRHQQGLLCIQHRLLHLVDGCLGYPWWAIRVLRRALTHCTLQPLNLPCQTGKELINLLFPLMMRMFIILYSYLKSLQFMFKPHHLFT